MVLVIRVLLIEKAATVAIPIALKSEATMAGLHGRVALGPGVKRSFPGIKKESAIRLKTGPGKITHDINARSSRPSLLKSPLAKCKFAGPT